MSRRARIALAIDLVAVVVFVAIGRRSHNEPGNALAATGKVAAPFLIAVIAGWVAARAWRSPWELRTGAIVWIVTVALGMVLRNLVFDRGTAPAFVIVATVFLGTFLLGWRALAPRVAAKLAHN